MVAAAYCLTKEHAGDNACGAFVSHAASGEGSFRVATPAPILGIDYLGGCPVCGNSEIDDGETCDDGNIDDGDGCDSDCQME